jgi:hypothetical protein
MGVKQPGCEPDHPPPFSAKLKKSGAVPPLPHTSARDCFAFIFALQLHCGMIITKFPTAHVLTLWFLQQCIFYIVSNFKWYG